MKVSLKVQDQHQNPQSHHHSNPLLLRVKVPVSVFGFPFLSGAAAAVTDSSDLSLSLRTNFASGPSLKLSYTPTSTNTVAATATPPLTLTLKSGVSLFGSPQNSPLIISAHFSLSPQNLNPSPTFSLQIKPQLGDFSVRKTTYSSPNPNPRANGEVTSFGFVPLERPITLKDFTSEFSSKDSLLSGIAYMAKTALPVTKRVAMNFRWGVNFPANTEKRLPFLTVNKIGIERVDEVKEVEEVEARSLHGNVDDLELLKCISISARRELEDLQKENREIKQSLDEMRSGKLHRQEWTYPGHNDGVARKASRVAENSGEFEQWKNKKSPGKDNSCKESKENSNRASDVESELQRAILGVSS